jgi:hypothetical protein
VNFTIGLTSDEKCEVRIALHIHDVTNTTTGSNSSYPQAGYLMGRFADGASTVADPYRVAVTPPVALRIARCVGLFMRNESKLGHWSSASRADVTGASAGGVWRRLTVRCNNEGHVLVVMQASPAGAAGGAAEVAEEVSHARRQSSHHTTRRASHALSGCLAAIPPRLLRQPAPPPPPPSRILRLPPSAPLSRWRRSCFLPI